MMAGFGAPKKDAGKKKKAKPAALDANKQWAIYSELRGLEESERTTTSVYARLPDEGAKWEQVGGVAVASPGSRQQGVMQHKRLILEHAARLHPALALRSRELVCGYTDLPGSMQSRPEDIVTLAKCDVPKDLVAGFGGLPGGGMYSKAPAKKALKKSMKPRPEGKSSGSMR